MTPSSAVEVTFFEDRARVQRRATRSVQAGRVEVSLSGVSPLVDDSTLIVRTLGEVAPRVLTARVRRFMNARPAATEEELDTLVAEHEKTSRELQLAYRAQAQVQAQRAQLEILHQTSLELMGDVPARKGGDARAWSAALESLEEQFEACERATAEVALRVEVAEVAQRRAKALLDSGRIERPEVEAAVDVQLEAETETEVEIEFEYYVPCALWRPSHIARLTTARDEVELTMLGTVWQRTGEVWDDVCCRFSTARPTQASSAPLLTDDIVRARPKTDLEKQVVQVEARDVMIASTGSAIGGVADEMPGVDDGGEPLTLTALHNVSIPSTGEPFRVEIATRRIPCETGVVAYAERASVPYLRAVGTWTGDVPILAGPVVVMRGNNYAGRAQLEFVPPGERFEFSFGVESGLTIHRTVVDEQRTTAVMGKQILDRTVKVFVSNLSGDTRALTVVERVPVSEIEEVSVRRIESATPPDKDGFVEFAVSIAPQAVETLELRYSVEHGSKVRLSL